MPVGKTNNPEGKNQYTSGGGGGIGSKIKSAGAKLGAKIGGAAESVKMQGQGIAQAAKWTAAANKGKSIGAQVKGMARALPAGRRLGAAAAKESAVGEVRGAMKGEKIASKAVNAAGRAKEKVKSAVSKMKG